MKSNDLPSGLLPHFNPNSSISTPSRRIVHNRAVEQRLLHEAEHIKRRAEVVAARIKAAEPLAEFWPYGVGLDEPHVQYANMVIPKTLPEDVRAEACQRVVLALLEGHKVDRVAIISKSWVSKVRYISIDEQQQLNENWLDTMLDSHEGSQRRGPGAQW